MARKPVWSSEAYDVGMRAQADFGAALVNLRSLQLESGLTVNRKAELVSCPNGENPRCDLAIEPANRREDDGGVDWWVWISLKLARLYGLDAVGIGDVWFGVDNTCSYPVPQWKSDLCCERGVVLHQSSANVLNLAARGAEHFQEMVWADLVGALERQMPAIRNRLATRQSVAETHDRWCS